MSDTRTLKDKLKTAPEVTSLSSTDRLMVVGSDGSPEKIDKANLLSDINDFGVNLVPGSLKKLVSSVLTIPIPKGSPVVVSFESYEPLQGPGSSSFYIINSFDEGGTGGYASVSAETPYSAISNGFIRLYTSSSGLTTNKGYFHKLKIEKGYSASKWSPAPEDFIAILGGGKRLLFSKLQKLAERRSA